VKSSSDDLVTAAHDDWAGVEIATSRFAEHVRRLAIDPARPGLALGDLVAACAALDGDRRALELVHDRASEWTRRAAARLHLGSGELEDVRARVVASLLDGVAPKLTIFDGRTTLRRWIAVIAVREALNLRRERRREQLGSDSLLVEHAAAEDPALAYLRARRAVEVKAALEAALATLSVLARNMLRNQLLDELTLDEIGRLYGVHAATASRQLADARAQLRREVRRRLMVDHHLDGAEADSVVRMVVTLVAKSLRRLLAQ
jgi:RNA polymerase sigma-70 factor, ECF subfamily